MIVTELVIENNEVEELVEELLGDCTLPTFLFEEEKYQRVIIGIKEDSTYVGIAYGVIKHRTDLFFLHFLYVKKEYRNYKIVVCLLESVLKNALDVTGANKAIWKYSINGNENDLRPKLLAELPFCQMIDNVRIRQYRTAAKDFEYLKNKISLYKPQRWKERGYNVIKWFECSEELKDIIREKEKISEHERNYLSPFIEKEDSSLRILDERTSFILTRNNTLEPIGWILCQQISEKEVKMRRFYMYTKERASLIGVSFVSYVLEVISLFYDYLYFDVVEGNQQMERFVNNIWKPVVDLNCIQCNLKINLKEVINDELEPGRNERSILEGAENGNGGSEFQK
ncbi:MAG: hypothetical protein LBH91_05015 [Prevotellaceae bacterium]|jgi:hypothetical protein|nr:hypothetical protein [Prevotellaceae bacterium]